MKSVRAFSLVLLPIFVVAMVLAAHVDADARRFGGGRSFGSRPSFSKSFSKPVPKQNSFLKKSAAGSNVNQPRRGLFGGMGGMFGGLLAGSLLGSLLFGGGFGGGFGMFDMLLIFAIIMLAMRFFRSRREGSGRSASYGMQQASGYEAQNMSYEAPQSNQYSQAETAWDHLRSQPSSGSSPQGSAETQGPEVPEGFDVDDFMKGAKMVFSRLQSSWDARDMNDIKQFTTQDVYDEINRQAADDPSPSKTEILMVNARLLEAKQEGHTTLATVYFDVLMREEANASQPEQVREVWHFFRKGDKSEMWLLDGIQQLEA